MFGELLEGQQYTIESNEKARLNEHDLIVFDPVASASGSTLSMVRSAKVLSYEVNENFDSGGIITDDRQEFSGQVDAALLDLGIPMSLVTETKPRYVVDAETGTFLAELRQAKDAAVKVENYSVAKQLKLRMDRIISLGDKINSLEEQKAFCLTTEEFDTAARIKAEVFRLRNVQIGLLDKHDRKPVGPQLQPPVLDGFVADATRIFRPSQRQNSFNAHDERPLDTLKEPKIATAATKNSAFELHSEQKIAVQKTEFLRDDPFPDLLKTYLQEKILRAHGQMSNPAPLSKEMRGDTSVLLSCFGEFAIRCLFSAKEWRLREAAVEAIRTHVYNNTAVNDRLFTFKVSSLVALHALSDRVSQVFNQGIFLVKMLYTAKVEQGNSGASKHPKFCTVSFRQSDIQRGIASIMPLITKHIASGNSKLQTAAEDAAIFLVKQERKFIRSFFFLFFSH